MIVVTTESQGRKIGELHIINLNPYAHDGKHHYAVEFHDPRETPFRSRASGSIKEHDRNQSIWGLVSKALDFCADKIKPFNAAAGNYAPPNDFLMKAALWPDGSKEGAMEIGQIFFCKKPGAENYSYEIVDPLTSEFALKGGGDFSLGQPQTTLWSAAQSALRDMERKKLLPQITHKAPTAPHKGLLQKLFG